MAKSLLIYASSLPNPNSASSPPNNPKTPKPPPILPITTTTPNKTKKKHVQQQLQLQRVERAIGAGSYRDAEPSASDENTLGSVIAGLWSESDDTIHVDQFEGPVEKKIRETGEWLAHNTETQFRISGAGVLVQVGSSYFTAGDDGGCGSCQASLP
ncbi:Probable NAD(P)H dehydrogenase subunit CRR3, chloroplastic [Linum perenne]